MEASEKVCPTFVTAHFPVGLNAANVVQFEAAAGGLSIPIAAYHYNHNTGSKL